MERKAYKIPKGKILVFGDLHLTNRSRGRHKDYEQEARETMEIVENLVKEEKPKAVFLLGDIIGYTDTVLKHGDFFTRMLKFFMKLNTITKGNVFTVKGNHDIAPVTDFNTLEGIGLLKNPLYVDSENVRYHFVNYGEEENKIQLAVQKNIDNENQIANIVLGHNDYAIDNENTWYPTDNPLYISNLKNMAGVRLIISGHIHATSMDVLETAIDGQRVFLYYTGSPSRVASNDRHNSCGYVTFDYEGDSDRVSYSIEDIELRPIEELLEEEVEKTSEEVKEEINKESIKDVVNMLSQRRTSKLDISDQIDRLPDTLFSERGKKYVKKVIQEEKNRA